MSETADSDDDGSEAIVQKLETATEHLEKAEALQEEAKEEAKELVEEDLDFDAKVTVEHYEDSTSLLVNVIPKSLAEGLLEKEEVGQATPLSISIGGDFQFDKKSTQRLRIKKIKELIGSIEANHEEGAPVEEVLQKAPLAGLPPSKAEEEIENLRRKGEVYEPQQDHLRTT